MRTVFFFSLAYFLSFFYAGAQSSVLDNYIKDGLSNNIVLKQKNISLEKASYTLRSARSYYLPTIALQGNYTTAEGGRIIPLPIGDLLNGVYTTLNHLTSSNSFPQLQNQNIQFLPQNFYDAKIHTTVPILNTDIIYNSQIQKQQIQLSQYELDVYKRELIRDIKTAYFNYLNALRAITIFQSSLTLADEAKRVNEKLLDNGKGVPAYLLRASSEIEHVHAEIVNAQEQAHNAQLYFNFLLNRPADELIDTAYNADTELEHIKYSLDKNVVTSNREELKMLQQAITLNETVVKMNKSFLIPKLNGFLDLGSQASNWTFDNQSRYYMVGLQLDVPIFSGLRNNYRIRQAKLDVDNTNLQLELTRQQLNLSGQSARNNLSAAYQNFQSSQKQLEAAGTYQRLIEKGYREGVNTFIETIDARNQLTLAEMAVSINHFKLLSAAADLERETSSYQIQ